MNLSDLRPADYNPRQISAAAREGLGNSMQDFGDLSGITYNRRTGNLVCGHQRVAEMQQRWGNLPIVEDHGRYFIRTPNGDEFPVRVVDWDEEKERLANVVANNPEIAGVFTADVPAMLAAIEDKQKTAYRIDVMLDNLKLPESFIEQASQPPPQNPPPINWHKTTPTTDGYGHPPGESFTATPDMGEKATAAIHSAARQRGAGSPVGENDAEDTHEDGDSAEDAQEPAEAQEEPPPEAAKPAEVDNGIKYPLYFVFRKPDFERWKAARKALKLSDSELALHLLGQYEAITMAQSDEEPQEENPDES